MQQMSISPFSVRPSSPGKTSPESERRRARIVVMIAAAGIVAMLLAYAISPGVRHAVGHAAHSVKHAVSHVFDPDSAHHRSRHLQLVSPLRGKPREHPRSKAA